MPPNFDDRMIKGSPHYAQFCLLVVKACTPFWRRGHLRDLYQRAQLQHSTQHWTMAKWESPSLTLFLLRDICFAIQSSTTYLHQPPGYASLHSNRVEYAEHFYAHDKLFANCDSYSIRNFEFISHASDQVIIQEGYLSIWRSKWIPELDFLWHRLQRGWAKYESIVIAIWHVARTSFELPGHYIPLLTRYLGPFHHILSCDFLICAHDNCPQVL